MSKKDPSRKTETTIPTSERVKKISEEVGIPMVPKDDPIYSEPATVYFSSRPGKSTPDGKADSEKKSQPEERPKATPEGINAFMSADMQLGAYAQMFSHSKDDFIEFALKHGFGWALHGFLERRGWLDEDWENRLDELDLMPLDERSQDNG